MRYFITLSYDGTRYHGWQIQPNGISVEECLRNALTTLLRKPVETVGAGRTDAGVHAQKMVAHFDFDDPIDEQQLVYRLNRLLPRDMAVQSVQQVADDMHARFSATSRTYHYYIHTRKNPFLAAYSCEMHYPLDFEAMNEAAQWLLTQKDFASFCKAGADVKTTLCTLTQASWKQLSENSWCFEITANRFLRNMVRAVVGTLVEVGRNRITLEEFQNIVSTHSRSAAGESMPAHALFLVDVKY
ncbi:MAG: tRNA pseudouridine(38-40) synthase TruA [Prevotella sp.]|nr:tRNA pseudouridine(38-40) synthase TruA [Prevotella sp.]